jgi:putative nucleotidyltransferase with HDIG domain
VTTELHKKILSDHRELSSLPQTLSEVLRVARDENSSAQQLADVLKKDPALTAKTLRLVNSPFYGARREISTMTQAVMTVGVRGITALALSSSVYDLTGKVKTTIDRLRFWRHSLQVAIAARSIAEELKYFCPEEAFISGLLHDIGIVILEKSFPERYAIIWKRACEGEILHELEDDLWGTDHAKVGQFLLEQWHLPAVVCEAVGRHHFSFTPETRRDEFLLAQIVALANQISVFTVAKPKQTAARPMEVRERLRENLGLSASALSTIERQLFAKTVDEAKFLEIDLGSSEALLEEANRLLWEQYMAVENLLRDNRRMQEEIARTKVKKAALEALKTITATFNHYVNNAAGTILGRAQLVELGVKNGKIADPDGKLEMSMEVIINGVQTICSVMEELKNLTDFETIVYHDDAYILDIENRIKRQLDQLTEKREEVSA